MSASSTTNNLGALSFEDVYDIVKRNDQTRFDQVYRTLLARSDYLTLIPNNEGYSILHYLVSYGALDLFNKVIAIPNIRFILLTKSATKPGKDILQISQENRSKSNEFKKLWQTIVRLDQMDRFVEYAKSNETDECKKMLETDGNLANEKPPYRKYYLIHHLAFANNQEAFDQLRNLCTFDLTLFSNDQKTASEIAYEHNHKNFAEYLESFSPEMRALRQQHQKEKQPRVQPQIKHDEKLEEHILSLGGDNMLACFTCPLTKEIFSDPVLLSDGFTYERSAIQQWLDLGHRRSPMTNIELTNISLVPNTLLKQVLNEIAQKQKK